MESRHQRENPKDPRDESHKTLLERIPSAAFEVVGGVCGGVFGMTASGAEFNLTTLVSTFAGAFVGKTLCSLDFSPKDGGD